MKPIFDDLTKLALSKGLELRDVSDYPFYKERKRQVFGIFRDNQMLCSYSTLQQIRRYLEKTKMTHNLKTWKPFFQDVLSGIKTFELRKNDRNYQVGDFLQLMEVDPDNDLAPTGRNTTVEIIYMLSGERWGLQPGYVVLGIK